MSYQYTPPGGSTYPDPEEFLRILRRSRTTDLRMRDPRPILSLVGNCFDSNLDLEGLEQKRKTALTAFDWRIKALQPQLQAESRAAEATARLAASIEAILDNHTNCILYGATVYPLVVNNTTGENLIVLGEPLAPTEVDFISPRNIRLLDNTPALNERTTIDAKADEPLPEFLVDHTRNRRGALARALVLYEILNYTNTADWSNLNTLIKGLVHAIDKGATPNDRKEAEVALSGARRGQYFIHSDMIEMEMLQLANSAGASSHEKFGEKLQKSLQRAIVGQTAAVDMPSNGSRAGLEVLREVSQDILYSDMRRVQSLINKLISIDALVNYGSPIAEWKFDFVWDSPTDYETNIIVIERALQAGIPLLSNEVYERIGFTRPDSVPDILTRQQEF